MDNLTKMEKDYLNDFSHLPNTREELLGYITDNYKVDMNKVEDLREHNRKLQWNRIDIELFLEPYGTPRPRLNNRTNSFYVKGAAEHKRIMRKLITEFNIIYTSTKLLIKTYQRSPSTMKPHELYLAEEGIIQPQCNPDFDNLAKTYADMMQGILIINDNIIPHATIDKFYSIKPRIQLSIIYASDFDSAYNMNKMTKSKSYRDIFGTIVESKLITKKKVS